MVRVLFLCLFLLQASLSYAGLLQDLTPLNRACLPQQGRMIKNEAASCHCPPQALCPVTLDEWVQGKTLPPDIANICCNRPRECTVERVSYLSCGQGNGISVIEDKFCTKLTVKSAKPNDKAYKSALDKVKTINGSLETIRGQISNISPSAYDEGRNLIQKAMQELQKITYTLLDGNDAPVIMRAAGVDILASERKDDNSLDVECYSPLKTKCCTRTISERCPIPPDPVGPNCATEADKLIPDRQSYFKTPPPACWCPTGNLISRFDENFGILGYFYICAIAGDCVAGDTQITMADGTLKPIQEIKVGEFVKGYMSINKVMSVTLNDEANPLYSINDKLLNITASHPLLTRKGWKAIDPGMVTGESGFLKEITKLEVGDELLMADESIVKVDTIFRNEPKHISKYNLSVGGDFTFTANGIVIRAFKSNTSY